MDHSLTVVLPMYNREREVHASVLDILEFAQSIQTSIEVIVVDDGSNDETYETACELARIYPQLTVLRRSVRQGLGSALDLVRHRVSSDAVIVHDGISMVNVSQLKALLERSQSSASSSREPMIRDAAAGDCVGSRRFSAVRALHDSMEQSHQNITGFSWMRLEKPVVPRRTTPVVSTLAGDSTQPLPGGPTGIASHLMPR